MTNFVTSLRIMKGIERLRYIVITNQLHCTLTIIGAKVSQNTFTLSKVRLNLTKSSWIYVELGLGGT